VRVAREGGWAVIGVAGAIDATTVETLRRALEAVLLSTDRDVWLDLGPVESIDSVGLEAVADVHGQLERTGRILTIVCGPGVRRGLARSGIGDAVTIVPALPLG
jgi:anti-anti-sigma factor